MAKTKTHLRVQRSDPFFRSPSVESWCGRIEAHCDLWPLCVSSPSEQTNIKATAGEDVTLPCSDPDNNPIQVIEWSRPGLGAKFVLLFKDGKTDVNKQHPSFKDRVELLDSEMTGGDVSLVLKKVQANDTGLFECRVIQMAHGEELRRKVYLDVIGESTCM